MTAVDAAVIGGSGLYSLFGPDSPQHAETVSRDDLASQYGAPSADVEIAELDGRRVAFLSRHGPGHRWPPHAIPYRANQEALNMLGVRQIVAPCAAGSLQHDTARGSLVVPDQLVDQTGGRVQSFHDEFAGGTQHAQFADPYCQRVRTDLLTSAAGFGWAAEDGGTLVVIQGPRFSTRAEASWYAAAGWRLVNMTGHPEAVLARESGTCYATLALVTDYAANLSDGAGPSEAEVYAFFAANIERMRGLLVAAGAALSSAEGCGCAGT